MFPGQPYRYDLGALLRRVALSQLRRPYIPPFPGQPAELPPYTLELTSVQPTTIAELEPEIRGYTPFGQPYYSSLRFLPTRYQLPNGDFRETPALELPEAIIVVRPTRRLVVTQPVGAVDSVKEKISQGHKQISITGLLISPNEYYPETAAASLIDILSAPTALRVDSDVLLRWGITQLVIAENGDVWPNPEYSNVQQVQIEAFSDDPSRNLTITRL
jgi:hypothetical protein